MATVAQLTKILSERLHEPEPLVRQKLRRLQDDGLLPVAKGRSVPDVTIDEVALAIFAILVAPAVKDASRVAEQYAAMSVNGVDLANVPPSVAEKIEREGPGNARACLAVLLGWTMDRYRQDNEGPERLRPYHANATYEFVTSWPEFFASIPAFGEDGEEDSRLEFRFHNPGKLTGYWQADVRRSVAFGGMTLGFIALDLLRTEQ